MKYATCPPGKTEGRGNFSSAAKYNRLNRSRTTKTNTFTIALPPRCWSPTVPRRASLRSNLIRRGVGAGPCRQPKQPRRPALAEYLRPLALGIRASVRHGRDRWRGKTEVPDAGLAAHPSRISRDSIEFLHLFLAFSRQSPASV